MEISEIVDGNGIWFRIEVQQVWSYLFGIFMNYIDGHDKSR